MRWRRSERAAVAHFGLMPNNPALQTQVGLPECLPGPGQPAPAVGMERQAQQAKQAAMKISGSFIHSAFAVMALAAGLMIPAAAWSAECWQGWGYLVEPKSLSFKSEQTLYVTDGPVDWRSRDWIKLFPIDPKTGKRDKKRSPVTIRPNQPQQSGGGQWGDVVDDVADVLGSKWSILLRLSHITPSGHSLTPNDEYSQWACGLD